MKQLIPDLSGPEYAEFNALVMRQRAEKLERVRIRASVYGSIAAAGSIGLLLWLSGDRVSGWLIGSFLGVLAGFSAGLQKWLFRE